MRYVSQKIDPDNVLKISSFYHEGQWFSNLYVDFVKYLDKHELQIVPDRIYWCREKRISVRVPSHRIVIDCVVHFQVKGTEWIDWYWNGEDEVPVYPTFDHTAKASSQEIIQKAWGDVHQIRSLEKFDTRTILGFLDATRKSGSDSYFFNHYSDDGFYTVSNIKSVLETREHIPNKEEKKKARQEKAKLNRSMSKSKGR
jgi:hypothetical protein